jgi:hypothetical protein
MSKVFEGMKVIWNEGRPYDDCSSGREPIFSRSITKHCVVELNLFAVVVHLTQKKQSSDVV